MVKRQLGSENGRVRANAVEALWHLPGEEARHIFELAVNDPHHRVVINALLGLYYQNPTALERLHKLAFHKSPYFVAATVWALDRLRDRNSIPVLEQLSESCPDLTIREKTKQILAEMAAVTEPEPDLPALPKVEEELRVLLAEPEAAEELSALLAEVEQADKTSKGKKPDFEAPLFRTF